MPCSLLQRSLAGLSRTSCNILVPAIRKKSLVQSIFLVSLLLKEQQDQFVSFRFREVWHVQFSPGQCARNSTEPTNQWSNQLLLIVLGSCNQGFDLKVQSSRLSEGKPLKQGYNWNSSSSFVIVNNVNRTATCSATSVARSVQIWAQYFNIGFIKTRLMISDRDQQIRMLFLTQQFRMLFLTQHVELASHGCVRQEIARVRAESRFSEYAVRHEIARVRTQLVLLPENADNTIARVKDQRCETAICRQHDR